MTGLEIEAAITGLIILSQIVVAQIQANENLNAEQKQAYIDRITFAQQSIPKRNTGG